VRRQLCVVARPAVVHLANPPGIEKPPTKWTVGQARTWTCTPTE
jgi:hypothetical protein